MASSAEPRAPRTRRRWRVTRMATALPVLALAAAAPVGAALGTVAFAVAPQLAPPASATGPTVTGSGSSYAAIAINQWVAEIQQLYGDDINYSTSSSVIGMNEFAQGQVTFGASEIGYSTGQANYSPPAGESYQYLPDVAGATCFMYNVNGPGGQVSNLRLNPSTLVGIFTGTITNWDDPAIGALNPGADLPDAPIITVIRSDASGENYILSDYFSTLLTSTWNQFTSTLGTPSGAQAIWPTPAGGSGGTAPYNFTNWVSQSGSDNASNYVASTNDAITYVETGYAKLHNTPCASVENASGNYVQPTSLADAIALETDRLAPDLEQTLSGVFTSTQAEAYSVSAYSYLITEEGAVPSAKGAVLGQFVKFLACQGQQAAGQLGYSPLPPNLVQDDFDAIGRINGAANPGSVNASNCPNPYVDGQVPLPGEPVVASTPGKGTTSGLGVTRTASGTGGVGSQGTTSGGSDGSSAATTPGSSTGATVGSGQGTSQGQGNRDATHAKGTTAGGASTPGSTTRTESKAVQKEVAQQQAAEETEGELRSNDVLTTAAELPGPSIAVWWTLALLVVIAGPPVFVVVRRRRRSTPAGAP